ncbi:MAG: hypothetical protein ACYCYN_05430, partial [Solirubrobacteraceae bacterium]
YALGLRDDGRGTKRVRPNRPLPSPHYIHLPLTRGGPKSGGRPALLPTSLLTIYTDRSRLAFCRGKRPR